MGGKAVLLLVMGFSLIFLVFGQRFGNLSNSAVDNMVDYYEQTVAHDCAVSGANIAANKIFFDPSWQSGYSNMAFNGGEIDVTVQVIDTFKNVIKVTSTGSYNEIESKVEVLLQPSSFSKFAYYSEDEGGTTTNRIWWTGNDTVWGPFHTQDYLNAAFHPVFMGKASIKKSIIYYQYHNSHPTEVPQNPGNWWERWQYRWSKIQDKPIFNNGFENGVDLPLPSNGVSNAQGAAASGGYVFQVGDYTVDKTIYLTFDGDSIKYKFSQTGAETVVYGPDFAPNGVIFCPDPDVVVKLKGTVTGKYTVGVEGSVSLIDNLVYTTDPRTDPNSTDLLGLVVKENVLIAENSANNNDINIHASIYCEDGGFGAENYSSRPFSGDINLLGGIIQHERKAVGTFGGSSTGFHKKYKYDERLLKSSPPYFPGTGAFEVVSWLEE